ncbi:MAG TPA: DNA-binding protein [Bacteroidales bacterium]|nr:DNA-binding protein [Bacteroidales bacterium]
MKNKEEIFPASEIENRILTIRGVQVMLDRDLAELYQVETKYINRAVKRNPDRFPDGFVFQLSADEFAMIQGNKDVNFNIEPLRFQIGTLEEFAEIQNKDAQTKAGRGKFSKYLPWAFTEEGVAMLSAVLHSEKAIQVSVIIIQTFVLMRKILGANSLISNRIEILEHKQTNTDIKFEKVFNALEARAEAPKQGIFFEGQIFDAWVFVSDLIQSAEKSIELWDHYVDASVLMLLTKRKPDTDARIYLKKVSAALQTDIDKHNSQYPPVEINISSSAHDRFLLIDNKRLYHIGASLKDLGKRCFAFSLMDQKVITGFRENILTA